MKVVLVANADCRADLAKINKLARYARDALELDLDVALNGGLA